MASKNLKREEMKERLGEMPERSFARLVAAGLPRKGDGTAARFPWPECFHWYIKYKEEAIRREIKAKEVAQRPSDMSTVEAERRERQARTEIVEMKRDQMRGLLVLRESYRIEFSDMCGRIRGSLLGLKSRYLRKVIGLEAEKDAAVVLDGISRDLLHEMRGVADDEDEPIEEDPAA